MVGLPTQQRRSFIDSQAYCGKYSRERSGFSPDILHSPLPGPLPRLLPAGLVLQKNRNCGRERRKAVMSVV